MALTYPRCYVGDGFWNRPYVCAPGKDLTWVKYDADQELQRIASWSGSGYPLTSVDSTPEYYPGPPQSGMGNVPVLADDSPGFWSNLTEFFQAGNNATKAAKVVGYATIAVVGGGLLLWYVPRKKR